MICRTLTDGCVWYLGSRESRDTGEAISQQHTGDVDIAERSNIGSTGQDPSLPSEWCMWVTLLRCLQWYFYTPLTPLNVSSTGQDPSLPSEWCMWVTLSLSCCLSRNSLF